MLAGLVLGVAMATAPGSAAIAQDFGSASPAIPEGRSLAALEQGLLPARGTPGIELAWIGWYGVPDLVTRSAAIGAGWGGLRAVAGASQTGDEALGWSAIGVATGLASSAGGVALRAVARRDRDAAPALELGPGSGFEAGAAAWIEAGQGLELWISSPQIVTRGEAPPLRRGLEWGAWFGGGGVDGWFARSASAGLGTAAVRRAGVRIRNGPLAIWAEARDQPVRGSIGIGARRAGAAIDASVESHPVLGETVRVCVGWGARRDSP